MVFVLPRATSLGLYARKNALPTLTINDIRDVLTGHVESITPQRSTRSVVSIFRVQGQFKK
jgi:hypothetical protein